MKISDMNIKHDYATDQGRYYGHFRLRADDGCSYFGAWRNDPDGYVILEADTHLLADQPAFDETCQRIRQQCQKMRKFFAARELPAGLNL